MGLFDWLGSSSRKSAQELLTEARAFAKESRFKDAIAVYEKIPRRERTPWILVELAQAYLDGGFNTSLAAGYAAEALESDPNCAEAVCIQGEVLLRERRTSEALDRFNHALRIDPNCKSAKRRVEEFRPSSRQPRDDPVTGSVPMERRQTELIEDEALARARLAQMMEATTALHHQGKYTEALPLAQRAVRFAIAIVGEEHFDTAGSLNNLGALLQLMGDFTAARSHYERALGIYRKVVGEEHPKTAESLNNLGTLLQAMGDLAAARPCLERALAIRRKVLGENHPKTAESLSNMAVLEASTGHAAVAFELEKQNAAINDRMIGQIFSIGSERQRLAFLGRMKGDLAALLSLVSRYLADSPEAVRVVLDIVLRRKALTAEALAIQRDAILGGRYPHLQDTLNRLTQLRRQVAQKTLAGPTLGETPATHRQRLAQWETERERLETGLARQILEMNLERQLRAVDRRAVAVALPEGSALIEFVRFDVFDFTAQPARGEPRWRPAHYLAFVLPAREPDSIRMIDLGEADDIERLVAGFRDAISVAPENRPRVLRDAGSSLRALILDKLSPHLDGRTRLLLAPDGDLSRLSFEALPLADGRLAIEEYQVTYLSCGRDVVRFGVEQGSTPGSPLVVADPAFNLTADVTAAAPPSAQVTDVGAEVSRQSRDLDRGLRFMPLRGTREEGERVAALLGVRPWLRAEALEARVKGRRSPRVLHVATHGFFLPDQPSDPNKEPAAAVWARDGLEGRLSAMAMENPLLRSGLALASVNIWLRGGAVPLEAEDGLLTAEDVTGMDLLDTELVVLSACDTALGQVHVGEGVFGLRRAFVVAGARRLIMSLWKVPDQQTRELMIDFYARVLSGRGVAEALRGAQLALKAKHPDPYFWAAFILQGDPGLLPGRALVASA